MILDMHVHTYLSGDSSVKPADYLVWINSVLRKKIDLDGVVFVEHQGYNIITKAVRREYTLLAKRYGVKIFQGHELETDYGHFLCYGLTDFLSTLSKTGKYLAKELLEKAEKNGSIVIPAHPGRRFTGVVSYMDTIDTLPHFPVIEKLNGTSTPEENRWASRLAEMKGLKGIGGSDAHYVTQLGKCLTRFTRDIKNDEELVSHLRNDEYEAFYS